VKGLIMGVDVIYNKLNTATSGFVAGGPALPGQVDLQSGNPTYAGGKQNGVYNVKDMDAWTGTFRVQRDFLP
jgi:hypothetical protein